MKSKVFVMTGIVLIMLLFASGLWAELRWETVVDSANPYRVDMRLKVQNTGNQDVSHEFVCDPWYTFSMDGTMVWPVILPVVTYVVLQAGQTYYFPMTYRAEENWELQPGIHVVQSYLITGEPMPAVGEPVEFEVLPTDLDQIQWGLQYEKVNTQEIVLRLSLNNPSNSLINLGFPCTPFYGYSFDGEMIDLSPVLSPTQLYLSPQYTMLMNQFTHYGPVSVGNHQIQIYINDENGEPQTPVGDIFELYVPQYESVTLGAGDQFERIPLDFYWRNNIYQCLWSPEELQYRRGMIHGISFYSNFEHFDVYDWNVRVYMANTEAEDLLTGWVPAMQHELVYDGYKRFFNGEAVESFFWLQPPFYYDGVSRLAMTVEKMWNNSFYSVNEKFLVQSCEHGMARNAVSDTVDFDPLAPPAALDTQLTDLRPKTTFWYDQATVQNCDPSLVPAVENITVSSYPNPFSNCGNLELNLPKSGKLSLELYNLRGQKLKTIHRGAVSGGNHRFGFDAKADDGSELVSGVYLCRISCAGQVKLHKLVLVRGK